MDEKPEKPSKPTRTSRPPRPNPSRDEPMTQLATRIPTRLHKALKQKSVEDEVTMQELVLKGLTHVVK